MSEASLLSQYPFACLVHYSSTAVSAVRSEIEGKLAGIISRVEYNPTLGERRMSLLWDSGPAPHVRPSAGLSGVSALGNR